MANLTLKQPTFHWKMLDKGHEVCNFEIEVQTFVLTDNYNMQESKKLPIVMKLLDHEGLRLYKLNDVEQESAK